MYSIEYKPERTDWSKFKCCTLFHCDLRMVCDACVEDSPQSEVSSCFGLWSQSNFLDSPQTRCAQSEIQTLLECNFW